jgi:hypothetical protein
MFRGRHGTEVVYSWITFDLQLDPGIFLRSGVDRTDGKARTRLDVSLTVSAGSALTRYNRDTKYASDIPRGFEILSSYPNPQARLTDQNTRISRR